MEPKILYERVNFKDEEFQFKSFEEKFQFHDKTVMNGSAPEAETLIRKRVVMNFPVRRGNNIEGILNGFDMTLFCNETLQPDGRKCNSNGMWPIIYKLVLGDCDSINEATSYCDVLFHVKRGWTPTNGGLKPYNYVLSFDIKLKIQLISATKENLASKKFSISNPSDLRRNLESVQKIEGQNGYKTGTVALKGFQFELLQTNGYVKQGRYISGVMFNFETLNYVKNEITFRYKMGVTAPITTLNSNLRLEIFGSFLQMNNIEILNKFEKQGKICRSGFGFNCQNNGFPEQTKDVINL